MNGSENSKGQQSRATERVKKEVKTHMQAVWNRCKKVSVVVWNYTDKGKVNILVGCFGWNWQAGCLKEDQRRDLMNVLKEDTE